MSIDERVTFETNWYVSLAICEIKRLEKKSGYSENRLINFLPMTAITVVLPTEIIYFDGKHTLPSDRLIEVATHEYD